jgi:hypothetical protein
MSTGPVSVRGVALIRSLQRAAKSCGVIMSSPRCGRCVLYCLRQASMRTRASSTLSNSSPLRSSSRSVPLKRSTNRFCCGLPFSMNAATTSCFASQSSNVAAMNSRPLSERKSCGQPCSWKSRSSSLTTSAAPIEPATRQLNATRVYSSTMLRMRKPLRLRRAMLPADSARPTLRHPVPTLQLPRCVAPARRAHLFPALGPSASRCPAPARPRSSSSARSPAPAPSTAAPRPPSKRTT